MKHWRRCGIHSKRNTASDIPRAGDQARLEALGTITVRLPAMRYWGISLGSLYRQINPH
jgi:hypothetical protein